MIPSPITVYLIECPYSTWKARPGQPWFGCKCQQPCLNSLVYADPVTAAIFNPTATAWESRTWEEWMSGKCGVDYCDRLQIIKEVELPVITFQHRLTWAFLALPCQVVRSYTNLNSSFLHGKPLSIQEVEEISDTMLGDHYHRRRRLLKTIDDMRQKIMIGENIPKNEAFQISRHWNDRPELPKPPQPYPELYRAIQFILSAIIEADTSRADTLLFSALHLAVKLRRSDWWFNAANLSEIAVNAVAALKESRKKPAQPAEPQDLKFLYR